MKKPKRTSEEQKILAKKIIKYYFSHPNANSSREIQEKFKINKVAIHRILSDELERRFNRIKRMEKY